MRRVSSRNIYFLLLCLCLLIFCGCTKSTGEDTETDTTEVSATTEALETVALKDAEIGDIVQMGTYEQDGDPETEDPICWDVLDKDGDAMLLISHDVITYQRFSDNHKCVIWEDSQIRSWLNQAFYEEAFDETEQVDITKNYQSLPSNQPKIFPWMFICENICLFCCGDMCVDFCRCDRAVPQHFLNVPDVDVGV